MHFFRTAVIALIVFAAIATARPVLEEAGEAVNGAAEHTVEAVGDAGHATGHSVKGAAETVEPAGDAGHAGGETAAAVGKGALKDVGSSEESFWDWISGAGQTVKKDGQDSSEEVKKPAEDMVKKDGQDSSEEVKEAEDTVEAVGDTGNATGRAAEDTFTAAAAGKGSLKDVGSSEESFWDWMSGAGQTVKVAGQDSSEEVKKAEDTVKKDEQDSSEEVKKAGDTVEVVEGARAAEGDTAAAGGEAARSGVGSDGELFWDWMSGHSVKVAGQDSSEEVRDAADLQTKRNILLTPKQVEEVAEQGAERVPDEVDISHEKTEQSAGVGGGIEDAVSDAA